MFLTFATFFGFHISQGYQQTPQTFFGFHISQGYQQTPQTFILILYDIISFCATVIKYFTQNHIILYNDFYLSLILNIILNYFMLMFTK